MWSEDEIFVHRMPIVIKIFYLLAIFQQIIGRNTQKWRDINISDRNSFSPEPHQRPVNVAPLVLRDANFHFRKNILR